MTIRTVVRVLTFSPPVTARLYEATGDADAPGGGALVSAVAALLARYASRSRVELAVVVDGALLEVPSPHVLPGVRGDAHVVVAPAGTASAVDACADLVVVGPLPRVELRFRADRFEAPAIERVAEHLRRVVEGLANGIAPSAIALVGDDERAWILAQSNVANVRLDEELPTIVACFEERVRLAPDATAVVDGARALTYRELDAAATALSRRLAARGVAGNPRVAVFLERGADAVIAFLGILKARATYVPIDTSYPEGRVAAILACADPLLVVTREDLESSLPATSTPRALLFIGQPDAEHDEVAGPRPRVVPDDVAYAFFTSGSTGQPKGVVIDHRALANYTRAAEDAYGVRADDRVLQAASLGFDLSLEEIVVTLTAGATLVVRNARPIASVQDFVDECAAQRLTVLSITSALWHELTMRLDDGSVALPPLVRLVVLGADVARPDVLTMWQRATGGKVRLVNSYGLTETTIVASAWEATREPLEEGWRALPIGKPLRNVSAYVLDATNDLAPVGVPGEVCIGGLAVGRGYLGDDALTAARFVPDPFLPGGRMYRTGDNGILRSSGELEFLGRADYQIKVNGVRIELGEIEARLREMAGVIEGIVVAKKNAAGETELEAHLMAAREVTPARVREHLERLIPLPTVPTRIVVVERFPLTPAGKIDRRALAAATPAADRAVFVAPASALEALVVEVTAEVLGVTTVGVDDGFMTLGGSSLSAVRAASILGHRLGRKVRAQVFFEHTTLRAACVAFATDADDEPSSVMMDRDATLEPRFSASLVPHARTKLENVLLTGATGYYGTFVLADLLRCTRAHVVCLVRAETPESGRARLEATLARRGCSVDEKTLATRLTVVVGDIEQPDLGVGPATFERWADTIDVIFHAAAYVNMVLPYESLRASNVLAVQSVLRLATTGKPKTVHHVSTVEVLSDTHRAEPHALTERRVAASSALLRDGYAQSKWVAEKLVVEARSRGVRAYIHRPGRLMGHSATGAFNGDDFLVRMIDACGQVGAAPFLDVAVDITPVDYASRALVRLAQLEPEGEAFHLVHPEPMSWCLFVAAIVELGYPVRAVPLAEWSSLLSRKASSIGASPASEFLLYLAAMSQGELESSIHGGYASTSTTAALGGDVTCPPVDARLVATYLRALASEGRFALAAAAAWRASFTPPRTRSSLVPTVRLVSPSNEQA